MPQRITPTCRNSKPAFSRSDLAFHRSTHPVPRNSYICPMSNDLIMYTDGAARGNPGPGGYGVILLWGDHKKELSGGYRYTTNNRMELMAVIAGLEALKK